MLFFHLIIFLDFNLVFVEPTAIKLLGTRRNAEFSDEIDEYLPIEYLLFPPRIPFYIHQNHFKSHKMLTTATKSTKKPKWMPKSGKERYKEICRIALGGLSKCYG